MEKGMKIKGGQDRSRQWHSNYRVGPGPFSKVSNLNIAVWIMHENHWNCHMSVLQESDCCLIFWVPKWYLIFSFFILHISFYFPRKIELSSKYQGASKFSFLFFSNTLQIVNPLILTGEFFDENVSSVKRDLVLHEKWRSGKDDAKKREKLIFWELKVFWKERCV